MQTDNIFIPRQQQNQNIVKDETVTPPSDATSIILRSIAQWLLILVGVLLPIFFVPGVPNLLGVHKIMLVVGIGLFILAIQSVLMVRSTSVKAVIPISLLLFAAMVVVAFVSAALSNDVHDAIFGDAFEVHTAMFFGTMLLLMFVPLVIQGSKSMLLRFMTLFGLASTALLVHAVTRIWFGADVLSFGAFTAVTQTIVGGFNDLAIFAGLVTILGLMILLLLPLRRMLQIILSFLILLSVFVQVVVDFTHVWGVLVFSSLLMLLFIISRDRLVVRQKEQIRPAAISIMTVVVLVASLFFMFAGDGVTRAINERTGTSYVEVRPSLSTTLEVMTASYQDTPWFGVGPNRFTDIWRFHKNPSINETIFWDTDFNGGYGFVPTLFVTIGLLGGGLFVLFHLSYLFFGIRLLINGGKQDSFWYSIALISFVASLYLWVTAYLFVPSATLLLLAALFTGLTFATATSLITQKVAIIPLNTNPQRGTVLLSTSLLLVIATLIVGVVIADQYHAIRSIVTNAISADDVIVDDRYYAALAVQSLATMQELSVTSDPNEETQLAFFEASKAAIQNASMAVELDTTDPANHSLLGLIYGSLAITGVDGALANAEQAFARARQYDPLNPKYIQSLSELTLRLGDVDRARAYAEEALKLKSNYTDAMVVLIQTDLVNKDIDQAIATTESIIRLEPNNPTRYFQLGVLQVSAGNNEAAEVAYRQAVALDPTYANARYLLALLLIDKGDVQNALNELYVVRNTNTENEPLLTLIERLESGESIEDIAELTNLAVQRAAPAIDPTNDAVTVPEGTDSDLVVPINQELEPVSENTDVDAVEEESVDVVEEDTTTEEVSVDEPATE